MNFADLMDYNRCNHEWRPTGGMFKTYHRSDVSTDNPLRQAEKCTMCGAVRVVVASYGIADTTNSEHG